MTNTTVIEQEYTPHVLLQPYIGCYRFREVTVDDGSTLQKRMPHNLHGSLDFFTGEPFTTISLTDEGERPFCRAMVRGVRTYSKYYIRISGRFQSFSIKFNLSGLYGLLGIPAHLLTNVDLPLEELGLLPVDEITERLALLSDPEACIQLIEPYLIQCAAQSTNRTTFLSSVGYEKNWLDPQLNPKLLAARSNLSLRQVERRFKEEIGISHKSLHNLFRFDRLVRARLEYPERPWNQHGYEFDYYDQMHLIKAFKSILRITPKQFHPESFAL